MIYALLTLAAIAYATVACITRQRALDRAYEQGHTDAMDTVESAARIQAGIDAGWHDGSAA